MPLTKLSRILLPIIFDKLDSRQVSMHLSTWIIKIAQAREDPNSDLRLVETDLDYCMERILAYYERHQDDFRCLKHLSTSFRHWLDSYHYRKELLREAKLDEETRCRQEKFDDAQRQACLQAAEKRSQDFRQNPEAQRPTRRHRSFNTVLYYQVSVSCWCFSNCQSHTRHADSFQYVNSIRPF